jgi:hypothetical protein
MNRLKRNEMSGNLPADVRDAAHGPVGTRTRRIHRPFAAEAVFQRIRPRQTYLLCRTPENTRGVKGHVIKLSDEKGGFIVACPTGGVVICY